MQKLIMVQPQLGERRQAADVRGQLLDLVVAEIEPLEFGEAGEALRKVSNEVLSQLQRGEVLQAAMKVYNAHTLAYLSAVYSIDLTIRNLPGGPLATCR